MESKPGFSVLMSVYHKDNPIWLKQSLESIYFKQTLKPSEIVLVEDGPLPGDLKSVINEYKSKINILKIISLPKNMGLWFALNIGLKHCSYEWVARMDADDISTSNRFEIQLKAIKKYPKAVIIGGYIEEFDEEMKKALGIRKVPITYKEILKISKFKCPFNHMSVIYRKSVILKEGGYPNFKQQQDYALWAKLILKKYYMLNIPYILVKVRAGKSLIKRRSGWKYFRNEYKLLRYFLKIGFYSKKDFIIYGLPRLLFRFLPVSMLDFFYKNIFRD